MRTIADEMVTLCSLEFILQTSPSPASFEHGIASACCDSEFVSFFVGEISSHMLCATTDEYDAELADITAPSPLPFLMF